VAFACFWNSCKIFEQVNVINGMRYLRKLTGVIMVCRGKSIQATASNVDNNADHADHANNDNIIISSYQLLCHSLQNHLKYIVPAVHVCLEHQIFGSQYSRFKHATVPR